MKKTWSVLIMIVLMAMLALPVMAAGPERNVQLQATTTSPLATPRAVVQATPEPPVESQPGFEIGDSDGKVVFGGTYTLHSGERLSGDLVVFGGVATMQADSRIDGNVVVFGGNADIAGRVTGDLVLIGGAARLRSTAIIDGQLSRVGGAVTKDSGAQIREGESGGVPVPPVPPQVPQPGDFWPGSGVNWFISLVERTARVFGTTVVLALLAVFVMALWREPMERVSHTVTQSPGISWVVGFLTPIAFAVIVPAFAVLSAILVIACGLGLIGFMLIAAVSLALIVAWLVGWIAVGQLIGERLLNTLGARTVTPAASAAAGTAVITLLWLGLDPLCGLGWLIFAVLAPLGLGAVVLTRFGTREYTNGHAFWAAPTPPAPPAPPAPPVPQQPELAEPSEPAAPTVDPVSNESPDKPASES